MYLIWAEGEKTGKQINDKDYKPYLKLFEDDKHYFVFAKGGKIVAEKKIGETKFSINE